MKFFPILIYYECDNCKRKFTREFAYKFAVYRTIAANAYLIPDEAYVICNKCANNDKEAKNIAIRIYNEKRKI